MRLQSSVSVCRCRGYTYEINCPCIPLSSLFLLKPNYLPRSQIDRPDWRAQQFGSVMSAFFVPAADGFPHSIAHRLALRYA